MVKKWIVMCVIILSIIGLCVWENLYIQNSFKFLLDRLTVIEAMLSENEDVINTQDNLNELAKLHEEWTDKTKVLKTIVWHTGMKDVEVNMSRIMSYTEENDYKEAIVELHALQDFCKHYRQDFTITIENIL